MEITEIYSHTFLAEISWKQRFNKRGYVTVDFTDYFFSESKFHVFLHCDLLWPSLIYFTCLVVMSSPLTFLHFLPSYFFFFIYFVYQVHLMNSYKQFLSNSNCWLIIDILIHEFWSGISPNNLPSSIIWQIWHFDSQKMLHPYEKFKFW